MPIYSNRPLGPAGGDLSGSYPDPQVINLSGSATGSFSGSFNGEVGEFTIDRNINHNYVGSLNTISSSSPGLEIYGNMLIGYSNQLTQSGGSAFGNIISAYETQMDMSGDTYGNVILQESNVFSGSNFQGNMFNAWSSNFSGINWYSNYFGGYNHNIGGGGSLQANHVFGSSADINMDGGFYYNAIFGLGNKLTGSYKIQSSVIHGDNNSIYSTGSDILNNAILGTQNSSLHSDVILLGEGLVSTNVSQLVAGQYNATSSTYQFAIGNGTDDSNRSNIVEVTGSNVYINGILSASAGVTGSFSGSFVGDGSGLVNLPAPIIPVISSSHILYVSADSTDTGADGSFNKPFATISASLAYAKTTYTSAEHVEIFLNPGSYPAFTLDRHNTYIKSDLSHERQRGATISGPVVINCSGSSQKYNQIVGFDGLFITGPSNSTSSTVYLTGSGAHLAYFKDCFLYSNTNNSHIFKCDTIFGNQQGTTGNKIVFKDSTFLAEKSGSSFLRLNGGDVEFNTCRLQANITGSGTYVSGSGDLYIAADRLFVETFTNGNIFEVSSSRSLALVVANSSISTYGAGKPFNAPANAILVGNNFFGGAIANNFNVSAFAVTYGNLSSITASNAVTISASALPLPMWETHGNIIANSVTGSFTGSYAGTFTGNISSSLTSLIDVSSSTSALRVTQRGIGNAILVEDNTNPDATPFIITNTGKVGISTLTPGVLGGQPSDYMLQVGDISTTGKSSIGIVTSGSQKAEINFGRSGSGSEPKDIYRGYISYDHLTESLSFGQNGVRAITISGSQNVGIGTLTPEEKLTISGNVKATNFIGSGSQITDLTASNITNFTADVRNQFSAGTNIGISDGVISVTGSVPATVLTSGSVTGSGVSNNEVRLKDTISVTSITASNGLYDYIDFNTSSIDPGFRTGRFHYGTGSGDIEYDTEVNDVTLKIGQQTILKVHNNYGSTLSKGMLIRFTAGNSSAVPFATTASWVSEDESAHTIGMVMANIAAGQDGYIILEGVLAGVNTAAYSAGDLLFLSSSGLFSNTPPPAGTSYHGVRVGQVVRSGNSSTGAVFVKVDNGYEINELHDTDIVSPTHGDLFMRSGSVNGSAQWINTKQLSGSYGLTGSLYAIGNLSASSGVTGSFSGSGASLDLFSTTDTTRGVVPGSSNAGVNSFLRADGTWSAPTSYYLEASGTTGFTAGDTEENIIFWNTGDTSNMSVVSNTFLRLGTANGNGNYLLNIAGLAQVGTVVGANDTIRIKVKDTSGTILSTFHISPYGTQFAPGQKIHFSHTAIIPATAARDIVLTEQLTGGAAGETAALAFTAENGRGIYLTLTKI